jgi:hypothetical protein
MAEKITPEQLSELNNKFEEFLEAVDSLNAIYPPALNESVAIANSMADHAQAILVEFAKWKGNIIPIYEHGYVKEKIEALLRDLEAMQHDIGAGSRVPKDIVFRNIAFDYGTSKWIPYEEHAKKKLGEII